MTTTPATFGATLTEDGQISSLFPVPQDWDGYRFTGYCVPQTSEVLAHFGSIEAATAEWQRRYGE